MSGGFCKDIDYGVDLNRNYPFKFGVDDVGSSNSECEEDYRGAAPFSEPETAALRDFITKWKDQLKIVINFHA